MIRAHRTNPMLAKAVKGSPATVVLVLIATVAGAVSGCAGTSAAYQAADTLDETAQVVSEHYYALLREANDMADAGAPAEFVRAAQAIEAEATPYVLALRDATERLDAVRSADNEQALRNALSLAVSRIAQFADLIRASR